MPFGDLVALPSTTGTPDNGAGGRGASLHGISARAAQTGPEAKAQRPATNSGPTLEHSK